MNNFGNDFIFKLLVAVISGVVLSLIKNKFTGIKISLGGLWIICLVILLFLQKSEMFVLVLLGGMFFSLFNNKD